MLHTNEIFCYYFVLVRYYFYMHEIFCDTIFLVIRNILRCDIVCILPRTKYLAIQYCQPRTKYFERNISRYNIASNDTRCRAVQYCLYITTDEIFHVQRHRTKYFSIRDIASNATDEIFRRIMQRNILHIVCISPHTKYSAV